MRSCTRLLRNLPIVSAALALALSGSSVVAQVGDSATRAALDPKLEALFDRDLGPGMAVVAVRDGEVVYQRGFGYADLATQTEVDAETVFYIASSTKSFLGMAAAILDERGSLDLDASLAQLLPEADYHSDIDPRSISLRDLLTHTHGIENSGPVAFRFAYTGEFTREDMLRLIAKHGRADSGTDFSYGNIGYNVAGLAIDGQVASWKDVLEDVLFEPLGMRSTTAYVSEVDPARLAQPHGWEPNGFKRLVYGKRDGNMHAAGGLVTTAGDLGRWLIANLNGGEIDGTQVIPSAAVAEAHRPVADEEGASGGFTRRAYSLGWHHGEYDGDAQMHHFGGFAGFHAHVSMMPERGLGVAVLANDARGGSVLAMAVAETVYDVLRDRDATDERLSERLEAVESRRFRIEERISADRQRRASRPQELPHPLEAYTGTYRNEDAGTMIWTLEGDRLHVRAGAASSFVEVFNGEENQLRVELIGGGSVVQALFEADDRVARAMRFGPYVFERVGRQ